MGEGGVVRDSWGLFESGLLTSYFIQLAPNMFERAMEQSPRIVIANVEFLANLEGVFYPSPKFQEPVAEDFYC